MNNINHNYLDLCKELVDKKIKARGITDSKILNAFLSVPRHFFVPEEYIPMAYEDMPLPIGSGQTISQPYLIAFMIEKMKINKRSRVLEIGTGYGYQTSLIAKIAREVYTIEVFESLSYASSKNFQKLKISNIIQKNADGYFGWEEKSPYDAIIVSCSPSKIPMELIKQLTNNGRLIIPLGKANNQKLHIITKIEEGYEEEMSLPVRFVPMIDKTGSKY